MNKKHIFIFCIIIMGFSIQFDCTHDKKIESQNEFVVVKTKNKKELLVSVKEDIACELELLLRQTSKNIAEQAQVQQQIFDKIKDLMGAFDESSSPKTVFAGSTMKLKDQRHKLKMFNQKLLEHQEDLQGFLSCF